MWLLVMLLSTMGCQTAPPSAPSSPVNRVTAIAAGWTHSCAVTEGGRVECWGNNQDGQLGDGTRVSRTRPVAVVGLLGSVTELAVGERHSCVLTASGGVKCWGSNQTAQLGDGSQTDHVSPTAVRELVTGIRAIAAGDRHTCALTETGGVRCWGENRSGQLGDGTFTQQRQPVPVRNLASGVQAIAAGWRHTCAVTEAGGVKCWGANQDGQLGDGTTVDKASPVDVKGLGQDVRMVVAGARHTCALSTQGVIRCWGANDRGQLGQGTTDPHSTVMSVPGLSEVQALSAGWQHTCAVTTGRLYCWGDNEAEQVKHDGAVLLSQPVGESFPAGHDGVSQAVAAGGRHTCALIAGSGLWCWGDNDFGQLARPGH